MVRGHRRTCGIGQPGHHREVGGDCGGVDHERLVRLGDERGPCGRELDLVTATACTRKPEQCVTVLEADPGATLRDCCQIQVLTGLCAAPTEHAGMRAHSIKA